MNAYKLSSGELLYPRRAEGPGGLIGDGWDLAAPGSPEFKTWENWAKVAQPKHEQIAENLRASAERARIG